MGLTLCDRPQTIRRDLMPVRDELRAMAERWRADAARLEAIAALDDRMTDPAFPRSDIEMAAGTLADSLRFQADREIPAAIHELELLP